MDRIPGRKYWTLRSVIDPSTGDHRNHYYFKRVPARRIPITSPVAKQLAGYVLIERDLRMVATWLTMIDKISPPVRDKTRHAWSTTDKDDDSHAETLGLFVAALSFYAKSFTRCEGRRVKLERAWIPVGFKETHDLVMQMRHNFAAHSGADKFEDVHVVLVLAEKKGHLRDQALLFREMKQMESMISWTNDEFSFFALATQLRQKVLAKLDELNAKLFRDEINPRLHEWLSPGAGS